MQPFITLTVQTKRCRNGRLAKQSPIHKGIRHTFDLINNHGSQTKLQSHVTHLERTFKETYECHESLMLLLPDDNPDFCDDWIEDLRLEIDLGIIEVNEYIASREGDPPSEVNSYTAVCDDDSLKLSDDEDLDITVTFRNDEEADQENPDQAILALKDSPSPTGNEQN